VLTNRGQVECEHVVLACGLWTRDLAERVGARVPLWPAAHVHVQSGLIDGALPSMPVLRDLDAYFYARHYNGRLLVGAFEPDGQPLDPASLPETFAYGRLDPDWNHFAPVRALAEERIPALRRTEWGEFLNAPESFTPDAAFCIGETNEVHNLFVSAGFNSQGIIYAPGAGRAVAEWIVAGVPQIDVAGLDVRRFNAAQSNRHYLHERTKEGLGRLYAMHWPFLQPHTARGVRRTPLHARTEALNACFGELNGWERPNWYAPPGVRAEYHYSYQRQNWFSHAAVEHHAVRQGVGVLDLSSFSKFEVAGPDALCALQWMCTKDVDVQVGRAVYTLMLNDAGGIDVDGTVTRLAEDRYMVVTPTACHALTLGMLQREVRTRCLAIFDATSALATIAITGPHSRQLLQRITPDDVSDSALAWSHGRVVQVADGYALCLRVNFTGELGFELYPSADLAVNVWDAVMRAGHALGVRPVGYHAFDSLRVERGFRHVGHDIGNLDDPFEAALGFSVSMNKPNGFRGRDALVAKYGASTPQPARRQVFVRLQHAEPLLYGYESLLLDGRIVARLTSAAYGHTVGAAVGLAYLASDIEVGDSFRVDCAGSMVSASVSDAPFYLSGGR
jgi:4-methylaminobutanoate oxidase (formaldehyde-forming)